MSSDTPWAATPAEWRVPPPTENGAGGGGGYNIMNALFERPPPPPPATAPFGNGGATAPMSSRELELSWQQHHQMQQQQQQQMYQQQQSQPRPPRPMRPIDYAQLQQQQQQQQHHQQQQQQQQHQQQQQQMQMQHMHAAAAANGHGPRGYPPPQQQQPQQQPLQLHELEARTRGMSLFPPNEPNGPSWRPAADLSWLWSQPAPPSRPIPSYTSPLSGGYGSSIWQATPSFDGGGFPPTAAQPDWSQPRPSPPLPPTATPPVHIPMRDGYNGHAHRDDDGYASSVTPPQYPQTMQPINMKPLHRESAWDSFEYGRSFPPLHEGARQAGRQHEPRSLNTMSSSPPKRMQQHIGRDGRDGGRDGGRDMRDVRDMRDMRDTRDGGRDPGRDGMRDSFDEFPRQTQQIINLFHSLQPPSEERVLRQQLLRLLWRTVTPHWPNGDLHPYGSTANELCLRNADMDVCLHLRDEADLEVDKVVEQLAELLREQGMDDVRPLTRTRVPIVKFRDPHSGINCDMCINNMLAVHNTNLINNYVRIDPRVRPLIFAIKHWAKARQINEPYSGTLSSYSLVLMLICYLQIRQPPVLPCLQQLTADGRPPPQVEVDGFNVYCFDSVELLPQIGFPTGVNRDSIGELLRGFFKFFAFEFDYIEDVVCVRLGRIISKRDKEWSNEDVLRRKAERQAARDQARAQKEQEEEMARSLEREETPIAEVVANVVAAGGGGGADDEEDEDLDEDTNEHDAAAHGETAQKQPRRKRKAMDRFWFCVEDPFEITHNLGRVVTRQCLQDIRGEFRRAARMMSQGGSFTTVCQPCTDRRKPERRGRINNNDINTFKEPPPPDTNFVSPP